MYEHEYLTQCAQPIPYRVYSNKTFWPHGYKEGNLVVLFKKSAKAVDPHEAKELVDQGTMMIDVRELSEWNHGHAPGAVHLPMSLIQEHLHKVPKNADVVVCCRSGSRSSAVVSFLLNNGYNAINMKGGMAAWHSHGLPVVNSSGVRGSIV